MQVFETGIPKRLIGFERDHEYLNAVEEIIQQINFSEDEAFEALIKDVREKRAR